MFGKHGDLILVSTLVVEWIEIRVAYVMAGHGNVSTLVVEWIEILRYNRS